MRGGRERWLTGQEHFQSPLVQSLKTNKSRLKLGFSTSNHVIERTFLTGDPSCLGFINSSQVDNQELQPPQILLQGIALGRMMLSPTAAPALDRTFLVFRVEGTLAGHSCLSSTSHLLTEDDSIPVPSRHFVLVFLFDLNPKLKIPGSVGQARPRPGSSPSEQAVCAQNPCVQAITPSPPRNGWGPSSGHRP